MAAIVGLPWQLVLLIVPGVLHYLLRVLIFMSIMLVGAELNSDSSGNCFSFIN